MKILITSDTYAPMVNGVVTSILNLREQLLKMGHDVRVLALSPDSTSWKQNGVYYVKSFSFNIYPGVRATNPRTNCFMDEIMEWCPDIIHTQCEFFTMRFAQKIARELNIPIVHTYHTMYDHYADYLIPGHYDKTAIVTHVLQHVLKNINTIIAPTQKAKLSLQNYQIQIPMVVIPTGIDLTRFQQPFSDDMRVQLRQSLGIRPEQKVLVTVGRLGKEKNVDELIQFLPSLRQQQDCVLVIVGDGPYKPELEALTHQLGLENHVFFTGMIPAAETWKYYKLGNVFVSGSISETQGLTYVEALASGTPLVCRQDSCLEGVLQHGYNGYFYTDKESYLNNLQQVLGNPESWKDFSLHAEESSHQFSKENFGIAVETLYRRMIGVTIPVASPAENPLSSTNLPPF